MKKYTLLLLAPFLVACSNYGTKVSSGNIDVYYKEGISKEQAEKTAHLFDESVQSSEPGSKSTKSFQLSKAGGDTITLGMVVNQEKMKTVNDLAFYAIAFMVSDSVFNGKPVNMSLTDEKFKSIRMLAYSKQAGLEWGEKVVAGKVEVYAKDLDTAIANQMARFLDGYMKPDNTISFQFTKNESGGYVVGMVTNPDKVKDISDVQMAIVSSRISDSVLNGSSVEFQLTDDYFKPVKSYTYPQAADNK